MKAFQAAIFGGFFLFVAGTAGVRAQVFTILHQFSSAPYPTYTNWDGTGPYHGGLAVAGNRLYGTTYDGGLYRNGTVFSIGTDGSDFTVLHTFSPAPPPYYTNADGNNPAADLIVVGDRLYGTTTYGGTNNNGYGTVFSVKTNGADFLNLHSFLDPSDGQILQTRLVLADGRLYGAASAGGGTNNEEGTIFSINPDGSDFRVLFTFSADVTNYPYTDSTGGYPFGNLILSGDTLYGTAEYRGPASDGTVFSIKTNGSNFTVLHSFTNGDGAYPNAGLVLKGSTLFGTATFGGAHGAGTVFSIRTDGTGFRVIHDFLYRNVPLTNSDGAYPMGLLLSGETLFGVVEDGGPYDRGVLFSMRTDGSDYTLLHAFHPDYLDSDGENPQGSLTLCGNTLYGVTEYGGENGNGTIFSLTVSPEMTGLDVAGANLVIHAVRGGRGQACRVLTSPDLSTPLSGWTPVSTNILAGGDFTVVVTNAVSPTTLQRYYTLQVQ